jgi:CelD/BcsL family acetyltransferase involved in cellulose biosynthesis
MSILPVTVDPVADPAWARLVATAPGACIFHHPAWLDLLRAHYGFPLTACCLVTAGGELAGGLPIAEVGGRKRRLVAVPFSDLCEPLLAPHPPPSAAAVLTAALDAYRRRRRAPLEVHGTGILSAAPASARFRRHVLALEPDLDAVERRIRPARRRGVRRALREGLVAERRTDREALTAFYRLHVLTRARLGVPTQPRAFVLRFAGLFERGLGFTLLVHHAGRPVAGAVFLTHRGVLTYKYGASDPSALGLRPNNLLFMEAIRWGCASGMHALDFGRTDWEHASLAAFKLGWGAEERELRYRRLGAEATAGRSLAQRAAHAAIRRGPPVTSRLVGEVLYRRAA